MNSEPIRELIDSSRIVNVFDELHYLTHSATDVYDDYIHGMRTRFDTKPVDESNVERVNRCRAKIEAFYAKLADLLIEGVTS